MAIRTHRFPVGAGPHAVEVRNPAGSVTVEATEGATEFAVDIDPLDDSADQLLDEVDVVCVGSRLRVVVPERRLFRSPSFAVRVTTPAGSDARVAVASADAVLRGPCGRVDLTSASGEATVESCAELQLRTASGDARILDVTGPAMLGAASADLHIGSVGAALEARTASGDVTIGRAGGDVGITTASGDVTIDRVSAGSVRVKTVSGDVTVGVVPDLRVWLDLSSVSGRIESQLAEDDDTAEGPAQVSVSVRSVSGDHRIRAATPAS